MCGIAAFFSSDKRISAERLKRATNSLHHRGPDSHGAWLSPNQRVGLGHTRLSIIDLTTGNQPIANEDERIHIVVNGEFYDFERQRRELEQRGHLFRTRSDSEIALHLYEEFGAHCVQQLRGEFAFVLWDEANQNLFAARDRFGIKPLYFAVHDDTLYLASEIKALFAAGVPARWDHEYFYQAATGPRCPIARCSTASIRCRPAIISLRPRMECAFYVTGNSIIRQRTSLGQRRGTKAPSSKSLQGCLRKRCGCGCAPMCR